jgi:hypothetical protein
MSRGVLLLKNAGVARDDVGSRFYGLNDYVQPATAGHCVQFINRQFANFVVEIDHVIPLFVSGQKTFPRP